MSLFKKIYPTNLLGSSSQCSGKWVIHHALRVHFQHLHTNQEWEYLGQAPFVVDNQEL